jgi:hypothetical protein
MKGVIPEKTIDSGTPPEIPDQTTPALLTHPLSHAKCRTPVPAFLVEPFELTAR